MNFQVTPFSLPDRVALFIPKVENVWRSQSGPYDKNSVLQRPVISVISSDCGHFLLVLHGDELVTIRDVCRLENCEFVGVFQANEVSEAIADQLAQRPEVSTTKSIFC